MTVEINLGGDGEAPNEWVHPAFGHDVDVVAIPIDRLLREREIDMSNVIGMEIYSDHSVLRGIMVMDEVFIAGFPVLNSVQPNDLPIYKSGFIASEPQLFSPRPEVLVDSKTKGGMSGSPVIFNPGRNKPLGMWPMRQNGRVQQTTQRILYPVYTGRESIDRDLLEAELGIVWPVVRCLFPILEAATAK